MSALEAMMPPVQKASVNGVELAYYEVGPRGQGVPIIFCHGFPELAFSWRHQLKACEAAGQWAIAPDQRGYGLSSKPDAVDAYDIDQLTADMAGLLDHLGVEKAIFCGHDWGGIVVWQMPLIHPDRVAGVIGLNTPFMPRAPADPIAIMRARFGPDMYIVWFQNPDEPEAVLGADTSRTMAFFMRKPAAQPVTVQPDASGSTFAFKDLLRNWDGVTGGDPLLTPDELAVFAEAFRAGSFFGPVSWYRNFTRTWERAETLPTRIDGLPCLMITAELDAVLPPSAADHMAGFIGDLETVMVAGSGHWTQQEKPDEVNALILGWLDRRFPT
ncbi:alpha/beta fold hydrolase [Phenylobacterium sp.]|jgi:pimeloyl-ACP methyl ester carboxylesterase|uniref:alpha/beta fold hydrolase n=1 Tax=Phenylobacterium sp. TaxID=1871053 RepID=UPI0037C96777